MRYSIEHGHTNLYTEFATKKELQAVDNKVDVVDSKVDELSRSCVQMAHSIDGLNRSVEKISNNLETLVSKRAFNEGMKTFAIKCSCVAGVIISSIITAHWAGIIKIIGKYLTS